MLLHSYSHIDTTDVFCYNSVTTMLERPDWSLSETRVYDLVSDKVRSGTVGSPTSPRTLSGRRPVRSISTCRILSVGLVESRTKSTGQCSGIEKRHDQTNAIVITFHHLSSSKFLSAKCYILHTVVCHRCIFSPMWIAFFCFLLIDLQPLNCTQQ